MPKKILVFFVLTTLSGSLFANTPAKLWPADAQDPNDPRVLAWYQWRCDSWRNEAGLIDAEGELYVSKCLAGAAETWPVGFSEDGDGE
jgi:hypothetical protein